MPKIEHWTDEDAQRQREAVLAVMKAKGLRAAPWAKAAGISSSSLYMFLKGHTNHLGTPLVMKLAAAAGVPVGVLTGDGEPVDTLAITARLRGDAITAVPKGLTLRTLGHVPIPPGVDARALRAAESTNDQPGPLGPGAVLYWTEGADPRDDDRPGLCVCETANHGVLVADLRRGFGPDRWTLLTVTGRVLDSVEVTAAHKVVWIRPG